MPLTLTNSQEVQIPSTLTKEITTMQISNISIDLNSQTISIVLEKGCIENSNFITIGRSERHELTGSYFTEIAAILPDNTKSLYENIKEIVYGKLISKNMISGTIV